MVDVNPMDGAHVYETEPEAVRDADEPLQIEADVGMIDGAGLASTVIVVPKTYPPVAVNEIMAVPADTPVTTPVAATTVATAVFPLPHEAPEYGQDNVVVFATQTVVVPETQLPIFLTRSPVWSLI